MSIQNPPRGDAPESVPLPSPPPSYVPVPGNGAATAAMVLGIVGAVLSLIPLVGLLAFPLAVLAITFGVIGLRNHGTKTPQGKGAAITGIALGALSLLLASLGIAVLNDAVEELDRELQGLAAGEVAPTTEPEAATETEPADDADGDTAAEAVEDVEAAEEPEPAAEPAAGDAPLGTTQTVGDYEVTVTAFTADATDAVLAENPFNDPPSRGLYALITFDVTYVGEDEGTPGMDLTGVLVTDGVQHADFECSAVAPGDAFEAPTLEQGGRASGLTFCFDHPGLDAGSRLFFEELLSLDAERAYWAIP